MDKVSIIIPIYNVKAYLEKSIESACNQSYRNTEIILVDDGSTDGSALICDELADKDERIIVIHKANGGLSSARNAGLDIATGKYIYFLDGDDTVEPNLLRDTIKHMQEGFDMVCFGYQKVYSDGVCHKSCLQSGTYELNSEEKKMNFIIFHLLDYHLGWEAWNRIYLRENIEKYHLRFVDNRKIFAEDLCFCLCYCMHVNKIRCITGCYYNYMQRKNSIMGEQAHKLNVGRMNELAKAVKSFCEKNGDCNNALEVFPVIHFFIIKIAISSAMKNKAITWKGLYNIVFEDISDMEFFKCQLRKLHRYKRFLEKNISGSQVAEDLSAARYLINGSYLGLRIRNGLIYKYSKYLDMQAESSKSIEKKYKNISKKDKKIYLIGTEDFGNIGDHQIAESILEFLELYCQEFHVFEVTASEYSKHRKFLNRYIEKEDIIILTGGGNFGDEYVFAQNIRDDVVNNWKLNKKIIFPQTVYFTNSIEGKVRLDKSKPIYTKDNNVYLFTREKSSYEFTKSMYHCDSFLVPDIVLFKSKQNDVERKKQILLCLRADKEGKLTDVEKMKIEDVVKNGNSEIVCTDTQLDYHVSKEQRIIEIERKLDLWRQSELVITDRLHGMIFAAITGTPCIALGNYNQKVEGTYQLIKDLPYVKFLKNIDDIQKWVLELPKMKNCKFDDEKLAEKYDSLRSVIVNE